MKTALFLLCLTSALCSCSKKQLCAGEESSVPGLIRSITGPDTLSVGTTVAIVVEVAASDSLCTKRAEGYIIDVTDNYVQIGATLVQSRGDGQHCNCISDPTVKTLVYFTPAQKGKYLFGTKKPDTNIGSKADTSIYAVTVP